MKIKKTKQEILNIFVTKYNTLVNNYNFYVSHEGYHFSRVDASSKIELIYDLLGEILELNPIDVDQLLTHNQDKLLGD